MQPGTLKKLDLLIGLLLHLAHPGSG